MKNRHVRKITAVVLGVLVFFGILGCSGNESPIPRNDLKAQAVADQVAPTMNLEGVWTHKTDKGGVFEATVAAKSIKILMKTPNDTSLVYWNGTFESRQMLGAVVVSQVNEDAFVVSKSTSKDFVVGADTLTFDFTQMGMTKKVELKRV